MRPLDRQAHSWSVLFPSDELNLIHFIFSKSQLDKWKGGLLLGQWKKMGIVVMNILELN